MLQINTSLINVENQLISHPLQEKVKHQLLHNGVQLEQFGGDVQAVEISAVQVCEPPHYEFTLLPHPLSSILLLLLFLLLLPLLL